MSHTSVSGGYSFRYQSEEEHISCLVETPGKFFAILQKTLLKSCYN